MILSQLNTPVHKIQDLSLTNVKLMTISVSWKNASWIIPELCNRALIGLSETNNQTTKP